MSSAEERPVDSGFSINVESLPLTGRIIDADSSARVSQKTKPAALTHVVGSNGVVDRSASRISQNQNTSFGSLDPTSSPRIQGMGGTERRSSSPLSNSGASPSHAVRSASPRHLSPATSQIFERDVQEATLAPELSPAIPSHIQTEDHIPSVLEASSLVITDNMNPDDVEIVMHSAHQPAAATVPSSGSMLDPVHAPMSMHGDLNGHTMDSEEAGSSYGTVDPTDPRRLSFISFADVVHAEHVEHAEIAMGNLSPSVGSFAAGRSNSPIRSPNSQRMPSSPQSSGLGSQTGFETSPVRGGTASPSSGHQPAHGELTIETMRQTLEKSGNSDKGVIAAHVVSPDNLTESRSLR